MGVCRLIIGGSLDQLVLQRSAPNRPSQKLRIEPAEQCNIQEINVASDVIRPFGATGLAALIIRRFQGGTANLTYQRR